MASPNRNNNSENSFDLKTYNKNLIIRFCTPIVNDLFNDENVKYMYAVYKVMSGTSELGYRDEMSYGEYLRDSLKTKLFENVYNIKKPKAILNLIHDFFRRFTRKYIVGDAINKRHLNSFTNFKNIANLGKIYTSRLYEFHVSPLCEIASKRQRRHE